MDPVDPYRGGMRGLRLFLATLVSALLALPLMLTGAGVAHAEDETPSSWRIARYDVDARIQTNGDALVTSTIDFDFSDDKGHGPFLVFVTRMPIDGDRDHWRMIDISDVTVTSPSGAPANVQVSHPSGTLMLKIGHKSKTVRDVQRYVVTFRLQGITSPRNASSGLDEVNWAAIGHGFEVPIDEALVTLHLPTAPTRTACFFNGKACESLDASGSTVVYRQSDLGKKKGLQVVAGLPAGTLVGAEPRLTDRINPARAFNPSGLNGLIAALVAAVGAGGIARIVRRHGRDLAYVGLTPGLAPTTDAPAAVGRAARRAPLAVAFTPPAGTTPGEVGTLIDEKADNRDVVATIISLAVRGHIQIEQTDDKSWTLVRQPGTDDSALQPQEVSVLGSLFGKDREITTKELKKAQHAKLLPDAKAALYRQVTDHRHWFRSNPQSTRIAWLVGGIGLFVGGIAMCFAGLGINLSLPGIALALVGLGLAAFSGSMPSRTAEGSAVLARARGFELYLRTAEADQLKFEEGEDIFSRYLPWAIMLGVAERWTKLFEQLAAEGRYTFESGWYQPNGFGYGYFYGSMGSFEETLTSSMQDAVQAASTSSSGGSSGFSGGGGFGGGGGGGW